MALELPFTTLDVTPPNMVATIASGSDGSVSCDRWDRSSMVTVSFRPPTWDIPCKAGNFFWLPVYYCDTWPIMICRTSFSTGADCSPAMSPSRSHSTSLVWSSTPSHMPRQRPHLPEASQRPSCYWTRAPTRCSYPLLSFLAALSSTRQTSCIMWRFPSCLMQGEGRYWQSVPGFGQDTCYGVRKTWRWVVPIDLDSNYTLWLAASDDLGNIDTVVPALPFASPDITPPVFLGMWLCWKQHEGSVQVWSCFSIYI